MHEDHPHNLINKSVQ